MMSEEGTVMKNLTIRTKLALAFGGLLAVTLLVAGFALALLVKSNERFENYIHGVNARALMAAHLRAAVDLRAISARNLVLVNEPADLAAEKELVLQAHADATESLAHLVSLAQAPGVSDRARKLIAELSAVEKAYAPVALQIVDLALKGQRDEAVRRMNNDCRPLLVKLVKASDAYAEFTAQVSSTQMEESAQAYVLQRNMLVITCIVAALLAIVSGLLIERNLRHDLGAEPADLRMLVGAVADGDLSHSIQVAQGDEDSVLASVHRMQAGLMRIVTMVRRDAEDVSIASEQIFSGNNDLASRTESQASSLEETAASMEQFGSTVRQNADNARQANQLARNASAVAGHGGEAVGRVVATMQGINDSSSKIADIIGVIDGIAFQTNILALNAAVEAARAGEAGRGFAVVASEVRSLAGRSSEAAREIKSLISDSVERVEQGAAQVQAAGKTMADIVDEIQRVTTVVEAISVSTNEQSQNVAQVCETVNHLDQATQQNAAMVEELSAAASSLQDKAQTLVKTVAVFKLPHSGSQELVLLMN